MDEAALTQMVDEIAAVLCKYFPEGDNCTLHSASANMKSKTQAQVFAFLADKKGVFSVNAEVRHPPPVPSKLNLTCVTSK